MVRRQSHQAAPRPRGDLVQQLSAAACGGRVAGCWRRRVRAVVWPDPLPPLHRHESCEPPTIHRAAPCVPLRRNASCEVSTGLRSQRRRPAMCSPLRRLPATGPVHPPPPRGQAAFASYGPPLPPSGACHHRLTVPAPWPRGVRQARASASPKRRLPSPTHGGALPRRAPVVKRVSRRLQAVLLSGFLQLPAGRWFVRSPACKGLGVGAQGLALCTGCTIAGPPPLAPWMIVRSLRPLAVAVQGGMAPLSAKLGCT